VLVGWVDVWIVAECSVDNVGGCGVVGWEFAEVSAIEIICLAHRGAVNI